MACNFKVLFSVWTYTSLWSPQGTGTEDMGDKRQETGDRRNEIRDKKREHRLETRHRRQETRDGRQEAGDRRRERVLCTDRKKSAKFDISMNIC